MDRKKVRKSKEKKRVLVVEDDRDMRMLYRYMFQDMGMRYPVRIVGDTQSALRLLKTTRFDVIISDVIMERIVGEPFIRRVRSETKHATIPVLIVTVLGSHMLSQLKKMERIYFLEKPITKEFLLQTLDRITGS